MKGISAICPVITENVEDSLVKMHVPISQCVKAITPQCQTRFMAL